MRFLYKCFPALSLLAPALTLAAVSTLHAGGYPHYLQNGIECTDCHNVRGTQPKLLWEQPAQQDIDHTASNQLCWSCHNDSDAPAVYTHSSLQTSDQYGNWTVECVVCHDPHFQLQTLSYPGDYIFQGVVDTVDATTLKKTGAADWTPDAYTGMIVFPNKGRVDASYRIVGNSTDTLTVDPDVSTPQADGTMNLSLVGAGTTFIISYGKLVRNRIDLGRIMEYSSTDLPLPDPTYPHSGVREVKFIRPTGTNSFADGDATINGICEVCHTRTSHWRNDGTLAGEGIHTGQGGGNCLVCHKHTDGFSPFNHVKEGAVTATPACSACHETGNPIAGVHGNNCGLCHLNSYGGGPLVEPYETDRPLGGQCSECHDWVIGNHDEVPHTATPPAGVVRIWDEGGHDSAMVGPGEVNVVCSGCHTTNLKAAHAQYCSNCHTSPVDTLGTWNGGCQQGGCHVTYHEYSNEVHYAFDGNDDCLLCHDNYSWDVTQTQCYNCHATPSIGPPVTTSNAKAAYNGAALIHLSVTVGGKVGIAFTFYRLDGGDVKVGSNIVITQQGDHTLEFWSVDQSGRVETPHHTVNLNVTEDTTPPVTTSNVQPQFWQTAWITLSATDESEEGVQATYYRLDGGSPQTYTGTFLVPGITGTVDHTLEYWSVDWSGNEETHHVKEFSITAGTATLRLVWGDSDTTGSPCSIDSNSSVEWEINRSGYSSMGGSSCYWSGVNDIVVYVNPNPYYVDIFWETTNDGDLEEYPNVYATTPGEVIIIRY